MKLETGSGVNLDAGSPNLSVKKFLEKFVFASAYSLQLFALLVEDNFPVSTAHGQRLAERRKHL